MNLQQLVTVLPCHSFDDFPYHLEGVPADEILASYTALWHPALITGVGQLPTWRGSVDEQPGAGCLVVLPPACEADLPGCWADEVRARGATVLPYEASAGRDGLVAAARQLVAPDAADAEPALLADFYALGLCHLLTEILTVRMRYSSLLDEDRFSELCLDAARRAMTGDIDSTQEALARCFDALAETKDHFYPVDSYLIDLTLTAPTTLGPELASELASEITTNLLITADDVARMASEHPDTLAALQSALADGRASLVGGEPDDEAPLPMMTADEIVDRLKQGIDVFQHYLDARPVVFGRRRFGLSPLLPQLLTKSGFRGALHFSLDGNRFPDDYHNAVQWQSPDGVQIHALARPPLDAQLADSILALPQHLGDSMDSDHIVAVCLAHWPGHVSPWYHELRRIHRYAPVLGRFTSIEKFFEDTSYASGATTHSPDDYRTPYLRQSVAEQRPAISPAIQRTGDRATQQAEQTMATFAALLDGRNAAATAGTDDPQVAKSAIDRIAATLPGAAGATGSGYLVVNPHSTAQHVVVPAPLLPHPPTVAGAVLAAHEKDDRRQVSVLVPPLGFVVIEGDATSNWSAPRGKPMVAGHLLRNEHFEVRINADTGAVQSVHNQQQRGNVLSSQLAMRLPEAGRKGGRGSYSVMAADEVEVSDDGPLTAALTSRGRLLDRSGEVLARYEQTVRIERNTPILYFDVTLDPVAVPQGNPWHSYYAARFAWGSVGAEICRSIGLAAHPTGRHRLEAPHYIQLRGGPTDVAILTGGLPYHRLHDNDQLDSLLIVSGETAVRFRYAVGFDLKQPAVDAMSLLAAPVVAELPSAGGAPPSGWLFHIDARNVVASCWEPVTCDATIVGVRLRLQEVEGRGCRTRLRSFRPLTAAGKFDFVGEPAAPLQPDADQVIIELSAYECCTVQLDWQNDRDD